MIFLIQIQIELFPSTVKSYVIAVPLNLEEL